MNQETKKEKIKDNILKTLFILLSICLIIPSLIYIILNKTIILLPFNISSIRKVCRI